MTERDAWVRRVREQADAEIAAGLRYDGKPLEPLEIAAVRVICGRLTWASLHWGDPPHPEAIVALGVAFVRAGWRPPVTVGQILRDLAPREAKTIPARNTDPGTSHAATRAIALRAGTQRARLLEAFALEAAAFGLTDEEAADLADGVPYRSEFAKRCSELREAGWIEPTGQTRKGVAGHDRIVSRITDAGRIVLSEVRRG